MNNLSPQDRTKLDNFSGMTVGQIFKKSREAQHLDIPQIAAHLNIGTAHLEAIESSDVNALPPRVYAVGFVRAYADLLGLDAEKMAYLFKIQIYGKKQTDYQKNIVKVEGKDLSWADMVSSQKDLIPIVLTTLIFLGLIVAALYFLFIWITSPHNNNDRISIPKVPLEMMEVAATPPQEFIESPVEDLAIAARIEPIDIIIKPDEGAMSYGADPLQSALVFKFLADNWVEIRNVKSGDLMISQTLKAGDAFYVSKDQDILLSTANGAAIEAYLDGQKLGLLGQDGDIIRLRPFSVEALRLQMAP